MKEKPRNPLTIIRHYIEEYQISLRLKRGDLGTVSLLSKLRLLETLEVDMETEYFPLGERTTIGQIRPGAVFATEYGVYAVKSQYRHEEDPHHYKCVLLATGG